MRAALAAGKHVLSQKPFVEDIGTGARLVAEAERRGLKLAVNQNGRWAPHLAYLREAAPAGPDRRGHRRPCRDPLESRLDRRHRLRGGRRPHSVGFRRPLVRLPGERDRRQGRSMSSRPSRARPEQTARPPLLAQALVAFPGGQASLVFDGATPLGARDMRPRSSGRGRVSSRGPDLGPQTVELFTEAGVARPDARGNAGSTTASPARWASCSARSKIAASRRIRRGATSLRSAWRRRRCGRAGSASRSCPDRGRCIAYTPLLVIPACALGHAHKSEGVVACEVSPKRNRSGLFWRGSIVGFPLRGFCDSSNGTPGSFWGVRNGNGGCWVWGSTPR